jgi:hypothetical protein
MKTITPGRAVRALTTTVLVAVLAATTLGAATAQAAEPSLVEWSTSYTAEQTVTVTETATVDGYTGTGSATVTASATETGTARAATYWEVNYYATMDAYGRATAAAKAKAEAEARPIAQQRAQADAQAKADAGPPTVTWTATATREETVTVTESATVDGFEGYGTATATASATASATATAATNWEVYYYATVEAETKARDDARTKADAEARALALQRAQADAQAQADAAANPPEPDPTDPDPTDPPVGPSCGTTVLKADGTPWTCTFADAFDGTELDQSAWSAIETSTSRFGSVECFRGLQDGDVAVSDGKLHLSVHRHDQPVTCEHPDEPYQADYTGGSVTSLHTFSQTYGRYEIRAAMPETDGPGLHSALWLVPDEPTYYGAWPSSGEIDIAEFYSANPDRLIPALHYDSAVPFTSRTNNDCLVLDPTAFHTYGLEWTAQKLTITIDGTTCLEHTISPSAPLLGSAPFDRAFNINLTQALGLGKNALPDGAEVERATMDVDYVRVWS